MESMLQKFLYAGVGLFTINKEQAEEIVQNLIERGEMSASEGEKAMNKMIERIQEETEKLVERVGKEVKERLSNAGFVRKEEYDSLVKKVEALEARLSARDGGDE